VKDDKVTAFASHVAAELLGEDRVHVMPTLIMGSEDFSYVLRHIPVTLMFLGTRPDDDAPAIPNHSNRLRQRLTLVPLGLVPCLAQPLLLILQGRPNGPSRAPDGQN